MIKRDENSLKMRKKGSGHGGETMTCKEAQALVIPYINQQLSMDEVEAFIEHVRGCKVCQEELEIYYIAMVGVRQLDTEGDISDIKEELKKTITASLFKVKVRRNFRIVKYAVLTLSFWSTLVMLFLQFRIWWNNGFL